MHTDDARKGNLLVAFFDETSAACLTCHRTGLKGALVSPHPVRLDCTQCRDQGEIKVSKSTIKLEKES